MALASPDPQPKPTKGIAFLIRPEDDDYFKKIISFVSSGISGMYGRIQFTNKPSTRFLNNAMLRAKRNEEIILMHHAFFSYFSTTRLENLESMIIDFLEEYNLYEKSVNVIENPADLRKRNVYLVAGFNPLDYLTLFQEISSSEQYGMPGEYIRGKIFPPPVRSS